MPRIYFQARFIFAVLLLIHTRMINATPALLNPPPSLTNSNTTTNDLVLHCFTPGMHPDRRISNLRDCKDALAKLVLEPNFITPYRFSKNKRRLDVIPVPKGWSSGSCLIFVSCENDHDTDVLRFADVARQARTVIRACVEGKEEPYGGINGVGPLGTFYVSVGTPISRERLTISEEDRSNLTVANAMSLGADVGSGCDPQGRE